MAEEREVVKKGVENLVLKLVRFFDEEASVSFEEVDGIMFFCVSTSFPRLLIGYRGRNILSLQFLVQTILRRKLANKETLKDVFFVLDVNGYFSEKIKYHISVFNDKMREILDDKEKKEIYLPPMPDYARRVIHYIVSSRWKGSFLTESVGDGEKRRILIKRV